MKPETVKNIIILSCVSFIVMLAFTTAMGILLAIAQVLMQVLGG